MTAVVDYSWARPSVADLKAAGVVAVCRYLSYTAGKNLTRAEADTLRAAGIDIVSNWQNRGDPIEVAGRANGILHAVEAARQHTECGGPPTRPIYFSVDFNPTDAQLPAVADYFRGAASILGLGRVGAYGGLRTIRYLFDQGLIRWGWQTYAWSGAVWDLRARLRQVLDDQRVGGAAVDFDEPTAADFGQWKGHPDVTSAPDDLKAVQEYCHRITGQGYDALGIIHATAQGGGYHEGEDLLIQQNRAPGPSYPYSDYSYADARSVSFDGVGRDLYPNGRLAGGNYASAFDMGGGFGRFLEFNAWMRARLLGNDPRARDIRSMIYTLDGHTVHRIDRTGVRPDSGDSSHTFHTHFSFYRDSLGRRAGADNFLGLLAEFFEGITEGSAAMTVANYDQQMTILAGRIAQAFLRTDGKFRLPGSNNNWELNPDGSPKYDFEGVDVPVLGWVKEIRDAVTALAAPQIDYDLLAQKVAALLPPLTAAPSAADIADELARRLGNNG